MTMSKLNLENIIQYLGKLTFRNKILLMILLGALSALSFAPFYIFPFLIVCYPLFMLMSIISDQPKYAFYKGFAFGFGHFFAGLYWIGNSVIVEADIPNWVGPIMVTFIAIYLSLFPGLVAYVLKYIHRNHTVSKNLLNISISFIVLWSFSEWLRGMLFTGFPWNLMGYIWGFSDIMLQSTAIWGIYGLGLITLILSILAFFALVNRWRIISAPVVILGIIGLYSFGSSRLPETIEYVEQVNLKVVQANIQQKDKWPYENWSKNLITHMDMSDDNKAENKDIIIWPETAVIYSISEEPLRRDVMSSILNEEDILLTGFPRRQRDPDQTRIFNSLIAINKEGNIEGIYDKSHLVPFGEYIPSFITNIMIPLGLDKMFTGGQGFSHGEGIKTLNIDGMPSVGVLICYEIIFPGQVTDPENRPDWLLNITNDAWYGESTGPYQHVLQTRVRAIEEGLPLVRSASTGISAIIDPYGRIVDQIGLNKRGVVEGALPQKLLERTLYSFLKEWIFTCIGVTLIIANIVLLRRRHPQKDKA